jgi:hypothetical protein
MFAITRNLCSVAALVLVGAMQPTVAQAPSTVAFQDVSARSDCPVEQHPKAISPAVVACHAKFAPLPTVPPEINSGNPEHIEVLHTKGDALLRQLDRPEACGEGVKVRMREVCAILIYVLDRDYVQADLPLTYVVKIYRTSRPADGDLRDTVVFTVRSNNSEGRFGPEAVDGEVWELLADQRVKIRCKPGLSEFMRGTSSPSADPKGKPDTCRGMDRDVRYYPALLLGRGEAERVLNAASIRYNFGPAP